jgi:hypothetical protein
MLALVAAAGPLAIAFLFQVFVVSLVSAVSKLFLELFHENGLAELNENETRLAVLDFNLRFTLSSSTSSMSSTMASPCFFSSVPPTAHHHVRFVWLIY